MVGAGWEHVRASEVPSQRTGQGLSFALHSLSWFYPFNSMLGRVRDQRLGKTAHQRGAELGTTLSVSQLANRRGQKGRHRAPRTWSTETLLPLQIVSESLVTARPPVRAFTPRVLTRWVSCNASS